MIIVRKIALSKLPSHIVMESRHLLNGILSMLEIFFSIKKTEDMRPACRQAGSNPRYDYFIVIFSFSLPIPDFRYFSLSLFLLLLFYLYILLYKWAYMVYISWSIDCVNCCVHTFFFQGYSSFIHIFVYGFLMQWHILYTYRQWQLKKRRTWDSNPRYDYSYTPFPRKHHRPLGQSSIS